MEAIHQLEYELRDVYKRQVSMGGKEVSIRQPRDAIKNGIAMVPENRKEDGLVLCRSIMAVSYTHLDVYKRQIRRIVYGKDT